MEEHMYHTQGTDSHFETLQKDHTPKHGSSVHVTALFSNCRELASTEPSAMCIKA